MKNSIEIVPRGAVCRVNGEKALTGEAAVAKNLREREDALEAVGSSLPIGSLRSGERVLLADESDYGKRLMTVLNNALYWRGFDGGAVSDERHVMAEHCSAVVSAHGCGRYVVVGTSDAILLFRRTADGYVRLDVDEIRPMLLFGATDCAEMQQSVDQYEFVQPYTSWTALRYADADALSKQWLAAVSTMRQSAADDGKLCGAVVARCGVRLYDDRYVWASAPVIVGAEHTAASAQWATRELVSGGSGITGVQSGVAKLAAYRLAITAVKGIPEKWDGLVKSVDVLVSEELLPISLSGNVEIRCVTTTSGGSRKQTLMIAPRAAEKAALAHRAANVARWRVIASTTDFASLRKGKWTSTGCVNATAQIVPGFTASSVLTLGDARKVDSVALRAGNRASDLFCRCYASASGRVFGGDVTFKHRIPWSIAHYLGGELRDCACVAAVEVQSVSDSGRQVVSWWENLPFTPDAINALVTYPDARASHIKIWLQGDGGVMQWQSEMHPSADGEYAVAVSKDLLRRTLADNGEALISLPDIRGWDERWMGGVSHCDSGNPLMWRIDGNAVGLGVGAMAVSVRPLVGGGFGRYPLFLFCGDGLYALPQQGNGSLGDARLVSRECIGADKALCYMGDAIAFVNARGDVMRLKGASVNTLLRRTEARSLAWCAAENELWMLGDNGAVSVMMPSLRCYSRDERLDWLYSSPTMVLGGSGGTIVDISGEKSGEEMKVEWMSQPIVIDAQMQGRVLEVVWSVFSDNADVLLKIFGERGASCRGYDISSLRVHGSVGAPIHHRVVAPYLRSVRVMVSGSLHAGDVLRTMIVK